MLTINFKDKEQLIFPKINECLYTACYCEENIWKLCEKFLKLNNGLIEKCYVIFISNKYRTVPVWKQKGNRNSENGFIIWDYHVLLVYKNLNNIFIFDFDTTLNFPVKFDIYVEEAIKNENDLLSQYHRKFRVIGAKEYLKKFASDRRHMRDGHNKWKQEPPSYPCIKTEDSVHNIDDFISMDHKIGIGRVLDLNQFLKFFQE